MAKKSNKKKQQEKEQEREQRLYYGSLNIAANAMREVEKRQQESFKKRAAEAGIKKEYSYQDQIAREAVREIQRRQGLSTILNKLDEERKKKEEAKRQQEAAQRYNRIAVQAYFGTPAKNDTAGKLGLLPYKTQQGAIGGYADYLKEKKDTEERNYPTMTGLPQEGPVVDQAGAIANYKKQLEEKRAEMEAAQRNNRAALQAYYGTPAANDTARFRKDSSGNYNLLPYKTQQGALANFQNDLKKMNSTLSGTLLDGPVLSAEQVKKNFADKQEEKWNLFLEQYMKQGETAGANNVGYEANKKNIGGSLNISTYNLMNANRLNNRERGVYDLGSNPIFMSAGGLNEYIEKLYQTAEELRGQAEDSKSKGLAGIFDYNEANEEKRLIEILRGNYSPEEQAAAERALNELRRTREERREAALNIGTRINNQYKNAAYQHRTGETYEANVKNQSKEALYHTLTGDNYAKRTAGMSEEEKAQLDEMIEQARQNLMGYDQDKYDSLLKEADAYEKAAIQAEREKTSRDTINGLIDESGELDDAAYDPSLIETELKFEYKFDPYENRVEVPTGSREAVAYYYFNNKPEEDEYGNVLGEVQKEYFATPEMVDAYNRFYRADKENGTNLAGAFLDAIDPYLSSWKTEYDDWYIRQLSENPWAGIPIRILSYPVNAAMAIPNLVNTGLALLGSKEAADLDNWVNRTNKMVTVTREQQNEIMDKALGGTGAVKFLLNVADSIGDNLIAMGAGTAITGSAASKGGMAIVQLIMSGEATGHTFLEKLEDGKDPSEAAWAAIGDGIIEWVTERISLEALLKPDVKAMFAAGDKQQLIKYIGKASLAEGSEEIASDLLNWGLDNILSTAFNHETELKERYYELIVNQNMSEKDAWRQALTEKFEQMGMSGLAGAVSGGLMSGGRAYLTSLESRTSGGQINNPQNISSMIETGMKAPEGSLSRNNAEALQKQLAAGKKVSNASAGKLAQSIMMETNESFQQKSAEARTAEIARMLRAKGVKATEAQRMSEILNKAVEKGGIDKLSKREQKQIYSDKAASSVYDKLAFDKKTQAAVTKKVGEATTEERNVRAAVSGMFIAPRLTASTKTKGRNLATEDDIRKATGTEVKGPMGVIVLNGDRFDNAKLTGVKNVNGKTMYTVEIDGKEQTVDSTKIRARGVATAEIIERRTNDPHFYSEEYTDNLLKVLGVMTQQDEPGNFVMDADRMRVAAFTGQAMPQAVTDERAAKFMYESAKKEYEEIRKADTAKAQRNARKAGQGTAFFKGAEYGTKAFDAALEKSDLTKTEKERIRTYSALSKALGTEVTFKDIEEIRAMGLAEFKDEENKLYGAENKKGIIINLGGENITRDWTTGEITTSKHHIGVTYGHEFLHWLQRNSYEGYNRIVKYVFETQAKKNGQAWVKQQLDDYMTNQNIDLAGAIFEFVADSCDSIFSSKDVIDHVAKTNQSLLGEIKTFIKDLFARVRNAMTDMHGSLSTAGAKMINTNMRKLGSLINEAWDEAVSGELDYDNLTEAQAEEVHSRLSQANKVLAQHGLVATHSVTEANMLQMMKYDGIPAPSIAIAPAKGELTSDFYGEISLVFDKRSIDPQANPDNHIFGRDAWTPTFPRTKKGPLGIGDRFEINNKKVTPQNAVDIMKTTMPLKNGPFSEEFGGNPDIDNNYGLLHHLASEFSKDYGSIAELQADRGRIGQKTRDEIKAELSGYESEIDSLKKDIIRDVEAKGRDIDAIYGDRKTGEAKEVLTAFRVLMTSDQQWIDDYGLSKDTQARMRDLVNKIQNVNVRYAEAKNMRVHTWDEVVVAVAPKSIDPRIIDFYKKKGIQYLTYSTLDERAKLLETAPEIDQYRFSRANKNTEGIAGVTDAIDTGKTVNRNPSVINSIADAVSVVNSDKAYRAAVERGDLKTATKMLMDKLKSVDGVIPFMAPNWHTGESQQIAENLKKNDPAAILRAASEMAKLVPDNAVLIPMPGSSGTVEADSWTMNLANRIAELTGRPVVNALAGEQHESRQKAKARGEKGASQAELGFRQIAEIPEGTLPIFIDNTVGSGITADAARTAMGGGMTLAYTKTLLSPGIVGLKNAIVTYESKKNGGALVPLSQRFDVSKRDVRYSRAQMNEDYLAAVESGDTEQQQELVDAVANETFSNSKVRSKDGKLLRMYHGTRNEFNEFKREYIGSTGRFEGSGFNFTPYEGRAASYGTNVLTGYLNIQKPLSAEKKTISVAQLAKIIREADPTGDNIIANYARETMDYGSDSFVRREAMTAARQIWNWSENDVDIYSEISSADPDAESLISKFEDLGYDGLIHYDEDGNIKTAVAFNSNQFKRADPAIYEKDTGELIPLSERFNTSKPDIRFSRANIADLEQQYEDAYDSYNTEEGKKIVAEMAEIAMPDSKIRDKNGKLKVVYHQTNADPFTVFNMDKARKDMDVVGAFFAADYDKYHEYGDRTYAVYLNITNPFYDDYKMDLSQINAGLKRRNELIAQGYDGIIRVVDGKEYEYVAFYPEQIKSAKPFTEDDDGDFIPLIQRFNKWNPDIRFSRATEITEEQKKDVETAEENGIDLDVVNKTASFYFSRASYERSEYYKNPDEMAKMLARNVLGGETEENIAKAAKWIQDVTSISALIGKKPILDYVASPGRSSFKSNPEYGGSIDSSTICAKRRLQTGTIDAIQRALPDYAMTAEDFLRVRRMMKDKGYEVSCGLCYVESSRKNIAKYASQFMKEWNSEHPDNQVNMVDINTVLGLENTRLNNEEVYKAYEKFMNKLAQRKPKLFEMRSEYDNDILKHFKKDKNGEYEGVKEKNKNGGMRINSFSDFEIVHLIDMMQVIMDMSNVGLAGQAYTKVRQFAEALGPTGLKINMSMIAKGVDENGRIIFDEVEGMKWKDVKDLRDKYADNVGTVCVVFTEEQLMAAMADDRIDFIIPFHRSQWSKSNYADIGLPENVKDFTYWQNERFREPVFGKKKDGTQKKLRATNYMPNEYWDPNLSGKENAERYLEMCAKNNKIPKFWKWLQPNGDGSFRLKDDGSTDGYWKLLGDFKMYNHQTGAYAPQMPVRPDFDMDASRKMLKTYKGGHESFPEATDVVKEFVKEKKQGRKGISKGKNGKIQLVGNELEGSRLSRWTDTGMDVNYWMEHVTPSALSTEDEWKLVQEYRGLRTKMGLSLKRQLDFKAKIRALEEKADLTTEQRSELTALRNNLTTEQNKYARLEDELFKITSDSGFAGIMRQHNVVFRDYMEGKTQEQVQAAVDTLTEEVKRSEKEIARQEKELAKMEEESAVQTVKKMLARKGLARTAKALQGEYNSAMSEEELKDRLAEIVIRSANGEDVTADVEALATDVITNQVGFANETADEQLYPLRGRTIQLSPEQMKELAAQGSSLAEIRRRTKGSGIRFVEGNENTLESNIHDLIDENPSLRDKLGNAADSLENFVSYVEGLLDLKMEHAADNIDQAELEAFITASANIMLNEGAGGMNRTQLLDAIRKEAGKIGKALEMVRGVKESVAGLKGTAQKAQNWAGVLNEDTQEALRYYNKMARLAAETERKRVKESVIANLKSDYAKKLVEQQEKFREQMANDKKARELAADNAALRQKVSTVATRLANRIFAETDQTNVPEETKALVRQVLDMISAHDDFFRKVTYWDKQQVLNVRGRLQRMIAHYGQFDPDADLDWLVIKAENPADNDETAKDKVIQDLIDIETGLLEYRNAEGKGRISLADRKAALTKVQEAISEIWDVVTARGEAEIEGRKWQIIELAEMMREGFGRSKFKGERTGFGSKARDALTDGVTWGNLTPEYFFKRLKNRAMDLLHTGLKNAEDRSGLEAAQAKERIRQIAEETGFASWDGQEEHQVRVAGGRNITMTTEQIMALYATWLREGNQMRPEDTAHLLNGGFVLAQKEQKTGKPGRQKQEVRPIRMKEEQLEALGDYLTEEQKEYVRKIVEYMSSELAELGNEASMKMYGIKKFTEEFYFPIKSWGGVLNKRSDAGISSSNENRAAQQGFSKRVRNNASNAIEIGDFTPTAMKHVAGMITYNTVGPAIENLNKVLNQQLQYGEIKYTETGEEEDDTYKQNMRAAFQVAYGKQAADYLAKFMKDMNGGVTTERTPFDKLLSMFKKNAVAGSLSVAAQQPLSYIRAAMMINPKYLAAAISPQYWKGSYAEMMKHSGIAVIKEMGKFDMNFGQTMQEWITPEGMESKARKAWNKTTDVITGLPGAMDMMTWTRMWTAVKLEQMAENKGMDFSSDEFMQKVAARFNDLMRQTQVYDSVMTKSQNMRSKHWYAKTLTSFMAEPTLSLNVLADAFQNMKEKGGKAKAAKAVATFLLSAAAQAGAKALFGAGRSPDKKKTKEENFLNKYWYNLLSEANPFGLIPGYRQIVETLTEGEMTDDTMGMIAKAGEVVEKIFQLATGNIGKKGLYRDLEDSIGQLLQLTTDIPVKNLMRDFRAMVNWFSGGAAQEFTGDGYANRPTSNAVLKYQFIDTLMSNDLIGLVNKKLGEAGYGTAAKNYYPRIYEAEKAGNQEAADMMKEYVKLRSTAEDPEKAMNDAIRKLYKEDDDLSSEEKLEKQKEYGLKATGSYITEEYEKGNLKRKDAERLYRQENPNASDKDVLKTFDKIDWEKSGKDSEGYTNYTPLYEAIGNNKSDEIRDAADHMMKNGYKAEDIKKQLTTKYKQAYLDSTGDEKRRLMDALTKAYKAIGMTAEEALKIINGWKPKKEK